MCICESVFMCACMCTYVQICKQRRSYLRAQWGLLLSRITTNRGVGISFSRASPVWCSPVPQDLSNLPFCLLLRAGLKLLYMITVMWRFICISTSNLLVMTNFLNLQ